MNAPAKHTPGPWHAVGHNVGGPDNVRVTDCWTSDRPREEQLANAVLIARAPDLIAENTRLRADVETLREVLGWVIGARTNAAAIWALDRARSALASTAPKTEVKS